MKAFTLRDAALDDADDVFAWRNDPVIRAMAKRPERVTYEDHKEWFLKSLINPRRLIMVGETNRKVGLIRFDSEIDRVWEVSLYTAPDTREMGFGTLLLKHGLLKLSMDHDPQKVIAGIRHENDRSRSMFRKFNFVYSFERDGIQYFELLFPRMGPLAV